MKLYTQDEYESLNEAAVSSSNPSIFYDNPANKFLDSDDVTNAPADIVASVREFNNSIKTLKTKLHSFANTSLFIWFDYDSNKDEKKGLILKYVNTHMSYKEKVNAVCILHDYYDELNNYYQKFAKYWTKIYKEKNRFKILKLNKNKNDKLYSEFNDVLWFAVSMADMCKTMAIVLVISLRTHDGIKDVSSIKEFENYDDIKSIPSITESADLSDLLNTAMILVEAGEIESAQILLTRLNEASGEKIDQNAMSTSEAINKGYNMMRMEAAKRILSQLGIPATPENIEKILNRQKK